MPVPPPLPSPRSRWAFFLDIDGTMADIAPSPGAVTLHTGALATLGRLVEACDGAVALVSGRPIDDIDRLVAPLCLPAAGLHGLERRASGGVTLRTAADAEEVAPIRAALQDFSRHHPGTLVEDKTVAVALHYRAAPDAAADAETLVDGLMAEHGKTFVVQRGKMVLELRPIGGDKGSAVRAFMTEPPFAVRRPVFVGDDVTDEAGFATVNRMDGLSIRIGEESETEARFCLPTVAALHNWLASVVATLRRADAPAARGSDEP